MRSAFAPDSAMTIRINGNLKKKAAKTFEQMGLTVSDAVRLFFIRAAEEQAIPFEIKVPNKATVAAMKDADAGKFAGRHKSVRELLAANK